MWSGQYLLFVKLIFLYYFWELFSLIFFLKSQKIYVFFYLPVLKFGMNAFKIFCLFWKQNKCILLSLFVLKIQIIAFVLVRFSQNIPKQTKYNNILVYQARAKGGLPAMRPHGVWAFNELRIYHNRPCRFNWGPKNVHFRKYLNIDARIFFFFEF